MRLALRAKRTDNVPTELNGYVQNGVIVLTGGQSLHEGTPVTVSYGVDALTPPVQRAKRVVVPLVRSDNPGTLDLNNDRIAEIFEQEDIEYARKFMQVPRYDDTPWTDEERDALRA